MKNIRVYVSKKGYEKKPTDDENRIITNELKKNLLYVTPKQLAEYLCLGHSVCATFPNKKRSEKKDNPMWYIGFDLDHMNVSMEERLKGVKDIPTIAYHTFSHTSNDIRYRFIYVFTTPFYGSEFYDFQRKLMERNSFEDNDKNARNINRIFHGTCHHIHFSGICLNHDFTAVIVDDEAIITRKEAAPPNIDNTRSKCTSTFTQDGIGILTSVGVTPDAAKYYFTHSWGDLICDYYITHLNEESEYIPVEGDCYSVAPEEFYSLPRQWRYLRDDRGHVSAVPRKWRDGENRGGKLYQAIISLRKLNPDASPNELLCGVVWEYTTFYNNVNDDGESRKYDHLGLARQFVSGMTADLNKPRKPLKHPAIHITSDGVNKHVEAPKACAKERHKKIRALYVPNLDMETNLQRIRKTLKIRLSERTLKKIVRESNALSSASQLSLEDKNYLFTTLYDPDRSDEVNLKALQDNISISRATYYRWKKRWAASAVSTIPKQA